MQEEEGQSPADILGGRKISFTTLGNLFDVKEHRIRLLGATTKGKAKNIFSLCNVSDMRSLIAGINCYKKIDC